jgi:cell fate regulator YaaT (PSP1 superfamily)
MSKPLPIVQQLSPPGAEHLVEVGFKGNRRGFYLTTDDGLNAGEHVIVDAERGRDLGLVRSVGGVARSKCSTAGADASLRVIRVARPEEVREWMVLRADEERVRRQTRDLVTQHRLKMKVSDAEWQWDRNRLIIYFTADRRVDFRELVRDLARTFRTRIELKQIGVRDEAAMLGGLGRCGRQLCCATWLREIRPVSLQLAKDQNLSLNPSQISGTCGRLMCCLTYEHDSYIQARKRFPREGKILRTARGTEKVIGIDIWRATVTLLDESRQRRTATLDELKQEIATAGGRQRDRAPERSDADGSRRDRAAERSEPAPRAQQAAEGEASPPAAEPNGRGGGRARGNRPRRGREERGKPDGSPRDTTSGARTPARSGTPGGDEPRAAKPAGPPEGEADRAAPRTEHPAPSGRRRGRGRRGRGGAGGGSGTDA